MIVQHTLPARVGINKPRNYSSERFNRRFKRLYLTLQRFYFGFRRAQAGVSSRGFVKRIEIWGHSRHLERYNRQSWTVGNPVVDKTSKAAA